MVLPEKSKEGFSKIKKKIEESGSILVVSHIHPDGDSISACVAVSLILSRLGKKATVGTFHPVPPIYRFIKGTEEFIPLNDAFRSGMETPFDLLFLLDLSEPWRTGEERLLSVARNSVMLDHHISEKPLQEGWYVDSSSSSTCELIFYLAGFLGVEIDRELAIPVYTGILTDTGSFQFDNTTSRTFEVASKLVECGVNPSQIANAVYFSNRKEKIKLMGLALSTLEFSSSGRIGYIQITQQDMLKAGATDSDVENIINSVTSIDSIDIAVLFREIDSRKVKVSLRARGDFDVRGIAARHSGGGHRRAAACNFDGTLEEAKKIIIDELESYLSTQIER